jgi:YidC/Oxa1 family membrane protein insertase
VRAWTGARAFRRLPRKRRRLVFYAEDESSWSHFEPIIAELLRAGDLPIAYLTSSLTDPRLAKSPPNVETFFIGDGLARSLLFLTLDADLLVMTLPDLETFHLKRSKLHPVRYAYVFHSLISTHMAYRKDAFRHYDLVLASGPHHLAEIRRAEALWGWPEKDVRPHGYGRLDQLLAAGGRETPGTRGPIRDVLLAPSWGPEGTLETGVGSELVAKLLDLGYRVVVRPHVMTLRKCPGCIDQLRRSHGSRRGFAIDEDVSGFGSLLKADLLITDWSGTAFEFAFARERPVLFIDARRKVNNPAHEQLGLEPVEVRFRERLGTIVSPSRLGDLQAAIQSLDAKADFYRDEIRRIKDEVVYSPGSSGKAGSTIIRSFLESP